MSNWYSSYILK